MITVGMNYRVFEGQQSEFEKKFDAVLTALQTADGHEHSNLFQDVHDKTSYLITSEWSDEEAFMEFIPARHSRKLPIGENRKCSRLGLDIACIVIDRIGDGPIREYVSNTGRNQAKTA